MFNDYSRLRYILRCQWMGDDRRCGMMMWSIFHVSSFNFFPQSLSETRQIDTKSLFVCVCARAMQIGRASISAMSLCPDSLVCSSTGSLRWMLVNLRAPQFECAAEGSAWCRSLATFARQSNALIYGPNRNVSCLLVDWFGEATQMRMTGIGGTAKCWPMISGCCA